MISESFPRYIFPPLCLSRSRSFPTPSRDPLLDRCEIRYTRDLLNWWFIRVDVSFIRKCFPKHFHAFPIYPIVIHFCRFVIPFVPL